MSPARSGHVSSPLTRASGFTYFVLAALFSLGIAVQVFLAGLGVLVNPSYFAWHKSFAHLIEWIPLLMMVAAAIAKFPRRFIALTLLVFVLFLLQYVFLSLMPQLGLAPLRALHVVNAIVIFPLSVRLTRDSWRQLQVKQRDTQTKNLNPENEKGIQT